MEGSLVLKLPPEIRNQTYFYMESLIAGVAQEIVGRSRYSCHEYVDGEKCVQCAKWFVWYHPELEESYPHLFKFPAQPSITKVCRQIRGETLPIFYGINGFIAIDLYSRSRNGITKPFPAVLLDWLSRIKHHLPLMSHLEMSCYRDSEQKADESITMLTDHKLAFKEGVLEPVNWWARSREDRFFTHDGGLYSGSDDDSD